MSIKLVAIDIDGTLLNSQHKITPRVKEALQKQMSKVFVLFYVQAVLAGVKEQLDELALYGYVQAVLWA